MACWRRMTGFGVLVVLLALSLPPAAVSAGQAVALDDGQKERLNIFLSNFSEVMLQPFARGTIGDAQLIRFGIIHTWANNPRLITRVGGVEYMPAAAVSEAAENYFGLTIGRHQSSADGGDYAFDYRDGFYSRSPSFFPPFAGKRFAAIIHFTQITGLVDEGDGCYSAFGDIYMKEPQSVDFHSIYRPLASWDKRMLAEIRKVGQVQATIRQMAGDDGTVRYILLDYGLSTNRG